LHQKSLDAIDLLMNANAYSSDTLKLSQPWHFGWAWLPN